jgi:hypothetical protein
VEYAKAIKIVEASGMAVSDDGIAFTVCGDQLVNGEDAPPKIKEMNGWSVEDAAIELCISDMLFALKEAAYFFGDDFPDGPDGPSIATPRYKEAYRAILAAIAKTEEARS